MACMKSKVFDTRVLSDIYRLCKKGQVATLSASLAYYMLFSLFPTLAVLGNVFSAFPTLVSPMLEKMKSLAPEVVEGLFEGVLSREGRGFVTGGVILSLFAFVRLIRNLKFHLDKLYKKGNSHTYIGSWIFSFVMSLYVLLLLYLMLFCIVFGEQILKLLVTFFRAERLFIVLWEKLRFIVLLFLLVFFLVLTYRFLPSYHMRVREVMPGVVFSVAGWLVSSYLFSFYVENFSRYSLLYGSLGAVIILMTWLYILSFVLLVGANINLALLKKGS